MTKSISRQRRFLINLMLLACASTLTIHSYAGHPPWQTLPPGQWKFPPTDQRQATTPSQTQTAPRWQPGYGGWPAQQRPGYGQQTYYNNTSTQGPRIESELALQNPYVRQGVILKLSLLSHNNLLTAVPQIAESDQVTFQLLEGPATYSRIRQGQRELVNDYFYEVIPLRTGTVTLPEIRFSGEEQAPGYAQNKRHFDLSVAQRLTLEVREANPATSPWLPLEQLNLKVSVAANHKVAAGKPLPITVEINAIGMGGNQLPSLASQLHSDAFRVYRDQSRITTRLNRNNQKITGRRIEHFTLVPQYGGDLSLPPLSINWWNTRSGTPQRASFPMQPIAVSGASRSSELFADVRDSSLFLTGASWAFWIPLAIVFGIIFGYWLAVWIAYRRRGEEGQDSPLQPLFAFLQQPMREIAPAFSPLKERLRTTGRILNPVIRWHRWRRYLVSMLPLSVRFYFCVRFVDEEEDPEIWGYTLRFLANKHLGLPINAPYSVIGQHILDFHPKAEPQKIRGLIHELEESIYGHQPLDFERWKAAFKHEIRPSLRLWPRRRSAAKATLETALPRLNPQRLIGGEFVDRISAA
jgi:hypothetical protein